jgi:ribosomal protein L32
VKRRDSGPLSLGAEAHSEVDHTDHQSTDSRWALVERIVASRLARTSRLARREMLCCCINSGSPDGFEFFRRYVYAKAPTGNVSALTGHHRVEHRVCRRNGMAETIQFFRRADLVQLEQVTEPPDDNTDGYFAGNTCGQ